MTTRSRMEEGLKTTRFVLSILVIVACTAGLASAQKPPPDPKTMCEYADLPGIGPCDINQGFEYPPGSEICHFDDGCYTKLENCCPR